MNGNWPVEELKIFEEIRSIINQISQQGQKNEQQIKDQQMIQQISNQRLKQKHKIEVESLKKELQTKNNQLEEALYKILQHDKQSSLSYKNDLRRISDMVTQKQSQIVILNRQIVRQKDRISTLQVQNESLLTCKQSLQHTFVKTIQLIKSQYKQLNLLSEQTSFDKIKFQTNVSQQVDKLLNIANLSSEIQTRKKYMEDRNWKLKREHKQATSKVNELMLEVEKLKEQNFKLAHQKRCVQQVMNTFQNLENQSKFSKKSMDNICKQSLKSKYKTQIKINPYIKEIQLHQNKLLTEQLSHIIQILFKQSNQIGKIQQKTILICQRLQKEFTTFQQIIQIKQSNRILKDQLNSLKVSQKLITEDQILKKQHPTLYEFFQQKMKLTKIFQQRLQKVESQMQKIIQQIQTIAIEGVPQKTNQKQLFEHQKLVRSKVKKQMKTIFQEEKQIIFKTNEQMKERQKQDLKVQVRQQMEKQFKRQYEEMENQIKELKDKLQKQKISNYECKHQIQKNSEIQTQSMIGEISNKKATKIQLEVQATASLQLNQPVDNEKLSLRKSNPVTDQQLIKYLQMKVEKIQKENQRMKLKIALYKKEMLYVLQNYRIKSTKYKLLRCNQCLLVIKQFQDQQYKKCENCRMEFHEGEQCFNQHVQKCKKKSFVMKPKPKPVPNQGPQNKGRRTSNPKSGSKNISYSQQMDYF